MYVGKALGFIEMQIVTRNLFPAKHERIIIRQPFHIALKFPFGRPNQFPYFSFWEMCGVFCRQSTLWQICCNWKCRRTMENFVHKFACCQVVGKSNLLLLLLLLDWVVCHIIVTNLFDACYSRSCEFWLLFALYKMKIGLLLEKSGGVLLFLECVCVCVWGGWPFLFE